MSQIFRAHCVGAGKEGEWVCGGGGVKKKAKCTNRFLFPPPHLFYARVCPRIENPHLSRWCRRARGPKIALAEVRNYFSNERGREMFKAACVTSACEAHARSLNLCVLGMWWRKCRKAFFSHCELLNSYIPTLSPSHGHLLYCKASWKGCL